MNQENEPDEPTRQTKQRHANADKLAEMIACLRDHPCSAQDIHELTGMAASTAQVYLRALHTTVPPTVYIAEWEKGKRYWVPHYMMQPPASAGQKKDASKRERTLEQKRQYERRRRQEQRAKVKMALREQFGLHVDGRALRHSVGPDWKEQLSATAS